MIAIKNDDSITADGEYTFPSHQRGMEVLLEWEITAGSATVVPGYITRTGTFRESLLIDGTSPVFDAGGGCCVITSPRSGLPALSVSGAAGLAMHACATLVPVDDKY